jgi:hypothetical protein
MAAWGRRAYNGACSSTSDSSSQVPPSLTNSKEQCVQNIPISPSVTKGKW